MSTELLFDHNTADSHSSEIDTSYFVLTVDLWSPDGTKEVNLVRHSATSPSISATTSSSYPPPPTPPPSFPYGPPMTQVHVGLTGPYQQQYPYSQSSGPEGYSTTSPPYQHSHGSYPVSQPPPHEMGSRAPASYYTTPSGTPLASTNFYHGGPVPGQGPLLSPAGGSLMPTQDPRSMPSGMFTRNLIGSLCVSAFKLTDTEGVMGVWFILQDLSVRTEGQFR